MPPPKDPRTSPITELAREIGLSECDDEALIDLELLREIDRKDRDER